MATETTEKKGPNVEPISLSVTVAPPSRIVNYLLETVGDGKFKVTMRNDVYYITAEEKIDVEHMIEQTKYKTSESEGPATLLDVQAVFERYRKRQNSS